MLKSLLLCIFVHYFYYGLMVQTKMNGVALLTKFVGFCLGMMNLYRFTTILMFLCIDFMIVLLECQCSLMFMNIQFSSILLLKPMQSAPHSIPYLSYALPRTPGSSRRTFDFQIPQNSNTAPADSTLIPSVLNQEDHNQPSLTAPKASSSDGTTKLMFQQQNGVEAREQVAARMISISRNHLKNERGRKKHTIGGEASIQDHPKNANREGFSTSRSIPQDRSLSKLSSNYLEASIREEEEIFKKIEEKALQLRQKQKKGRQILKKIIKEAVQHPQYLGTSLCAIPPVKSKFTHRRGQSCDFPIPEEMHSSDLMISLDRVYSQKQEDEGHMNSILGKSSEAVAVYADPSPFLLSLQEQLNLEKNIKEKLAQEYHQDKARLQGQLSKALQQCEKSYQIIARLEKQKAQIQDGYKKRIEQLSLLYNQQMATKQLQIVQLATNIQQKRIKLQQIQQASSRKQENSTKALEIIQKQDKAKNQEYNQIKRKLQKELAQLSEDRRKSEQAYLREIQSLKRKIDAQLTEHKLLADQLNHNKKETNKKQEQQILLAIKEKDALQNSIKALKSQIAQLNETLSKLANINQQKEQARKTLQQYLLNAEEHIRKVEEKYHIVSRELTEKNVAYDFLWIQLQESQKLSANQEKVQADSQISLLSCWQNGSLVKQEERKLNHILSSSTLKDIKDIKGIMQQGEKQGNYGRNPSHQEIRISLPISHRHSFNMPLLADSQCSANEAVLEEIEPSQSKKSAGNIILKTQLSEVFSQQNDEIQDMLSNHNSNTSKMESSVGAFSDYSRIKSTQSALSHKQLEKEYQNKMKNSKMMAKLGKFKPKK